MTERTFAAVVRLAAEWTTTGSRFGFVKEEPVTLAEVTDQFFDSLAAVEPALVDIDRCHVASSVEPPFAGIADTVDRFETALASQDGDIDGVRRRIAIVAALAAVGDVLAERANEDLLATVETETGASFASVERVRHSAGQFSEWLGEIDSRDLSPATILAAQCESGWTAVDAGDWRPAADAFRRAMLIDPEDLDALAGHAAALRLRGEYGAARQRLESLLAAHPDHARANVEYAELSWQIEGAAAGREQFETALTRCKHGCVYSRYADALRQVGAEDDADSVYQRGIAAVPDDPGLRRRYARHLAHRGADKEAREQFERATACEEIDPVAHLWFGTFLAYRGEHDEARDQFRTGFEYRAAGDERLSFAVVLPLLERFVDLLADAGDDEAVVRWAEYALDHRSELTSLDQNRLAPFEAHLSERDATDEAAGESDVAPEPATLTEQVARTVARDTACIDDPDVLVATGEQYLLTEAHNFASEYFERALSMDPTHAGALLGRARIAAAGDDPEPDAFREQFEWAIAAERSDPESHRLFAQALERAGAVEYADAQYRAALDIARDDAVTNCWYGQFCADHDRPRAAREHLARGLRAADGTDIGVLPRLSFAHTLVELSADAGDHDAVREWCEHALSLPTLLTPVGDAQASLERALAERVDDPPTAANRAEDSRDNYWYAEVHGGGCNAILELDGREIHWTSNRASFFMTLPVEEFTNPGDVDVTVTVLRATVRDLFEGLDAEENVPHVDGMACTVTAKRYETGDIAAPETGAELASTSLETDEKMRFPQTLALTLHRE